ncbi:hypothetical protein GAYE_SCF68G6948 [Galdieria yellowstonensis]|uniref:Uncharacterized protein n=1 Tax=Galdieria yellowstonensis TaxID=3028027 RepID=A0AAV9INZ5_9RHOD|nr:hypothetical protein GAYE_SCF68G6948 [Galdieria yellowstonensis]
MEMEVPQVAINSFAKMQLLKIASSCRGVLNLKCHLVRRLFTQVRVGNNSLGSSNGHTTVKENNPVADAASLQHTNKLKTNPFGSSSSSNANVSNASKLVRLVVLRAQMKLSNLQLCFQLNIDDRKPEQPMKGKILNPVSTGKHTLVDVFSKDLQETQVAQEAEADYSGYEELLQDNRKRRFKFYCLASIPAVVKGLAPVSKILEPHGIMPMEKMGALTKNTDFAVREFKKGCLRIENDPDSERDSPAPSWENASKGVISHAHENLLVLCLVLL